MEKEQVNSTTQSGSLPPQRQILDKYRRWAEAQAERDHPTTVQLRLAKALGRIADKLDRLYPRAGGGVNG